MLSDRASKEHFRAVNGTAILHELLGIPMLTWNYKAQTPSIRHIGPMAQDFAKAFYVGEDAKHISTVDAEGVNMAATKALYRIVLKQQRQIDSLQRRVRALSYSR